ncbi:uncharacterized protein V6R79_005887 [Siganus canaliculatus]
MLIFFPATDGELYCKYKNTQRLVVTSKERVIAVLKECHDSLGTGGHAGRRRTTEKVLSSYHWSTVKEGVNKWIHPYGNRLTYKTDAEVSHKIVSILLDFGLVEKIITDQGREFVNEVNHGVFESLGVKHRITSEYHPQSNGQDERTNRTIKEALVKYCGEDQDDWDLHLKGKDSSEGQCCTYSFLLLRGQRMSERERVGAEVVEAVEVAAAEEVEAATAEVVEAAAAEEVEAAAAEEVEAATAEVVEAVEVAAAEEVEAVAAEVVEVAAAEEVEAAAAEVVEAAAAEEVEAATAEVVEAVEVAAAEEVEVEVAAAEVVEAATVEVATAEVVDVEAVMAAAEEEKMMF